MKPEVGRRAFVGTVVAGLPLLAGRTGLLAQGVGMAHDHAAIAASDPVTDQIVRQIALIHNSAQAGPRGAHARALASQLRMLAVYQRQQGIDDHARSAVRELIERDGRNAVLYAEPDLEMQRRARERYGFRADERSRDFPVAPSHSQREAALDELLKHGVTPAYDRLAATLEKVSGPLDRRRRATVTIAQDEEWWKGFCDELYNQYLTAQLMALPWCLTAKYFVWAAPACLAMEGGAATLLVVYLWEC